MRTLECIELGPIAGALRVFRTNQPAAGPTLGLTESVHEGKPTHMMYLAGVLLVDWPFDDLDSVLTLRSLWA